MSCGGEDSSYRGRLTTKPTSQKIKKPTSKVDKPKTNENGNDVIKIYSFTADWKVNVGSKEEPEWGDEHATYELFYTKSTNTYELKLGGFQPKNHSAYKEIVKMEIDINFAVLEGKTPKQIKEEIINLVD